MPFEGTRVVHPRFETHHAPVSTGAQTATVRGYRPDPIGVRDPDAGRTVYGAPTELYYGPARIQRRDVGRGDVRGGADHNTTKGDYLLVITHLPAIPLLVRDLFEVIDPRDPTNLVTYTVRDVARGSLRWETDLRCDLLLPTNAGGAP